MKTLRGRMLAHCSGMTDITPAQMHAYRERKAAEGYELPELAEQPTPSAASKVDGVGKILTRRLSWLKHIGSNASGCKACKTLAAQMDKRPLSAWTAEQIDADAADIAQRRGRLASLLPEVISVAVIRHEIQAAVDEHRAALEALPKRKPAKRTVTRRRQSLATRRSDSVIVPLTFGDPVKYRWATFMTVAPRTVATWATTLESAEVAGFEPWIFAEPGVDNLPDDQCVVRPATVTPALFDMLGPNNEFGPLQNYVQSLNDILALQPDANMFLYLQDDVTLPIGLKDALESIVWPDASLLSLWCPSHPKYEVEPAGLNTTPNPSIMGAQGYVMPRSTVELLATSKIMHEWQGRPKPRRSNRYKGHNRRTFDYATGQALHEAGKQYLYCTRSLVNHFEPQEKNSSIGNAGASKGVFRSFRYVGDDATVEDIKATFQSEAVYVVILGHNLAEKTVRCIEAVRASTVPTFICYVDNGSEPEQFRAVCEALTGEPHDVIVNAENMQYTFAAQQGIDRRPDGMHVLMLNNDAYVEPDTIARQLLTLSVRNVGSVCPVSDDKSTCSRTHRHNRGHGLREVKQLPWFCCLLHRDALDLLDQFPADDGMKTGQGLDYWWSEQVSKHGWRHMINKDAFASHDHHSTFDATGQDLSRAQQNYRDWRALQDAP